VIGKNRRAQAGGCIPHAETRAQDKLFHVEERAVVQVADRFKELPIYHQTGAV
jgi:hypothetical protein